MSGNLTTIERANNATCPDCGRPTAASGTFRVVARAGKLVRVCKAPAACQRRQELRRADPELFAELGFARPAPTER